MVTSPNFPVAEIREFWPTMRLTTVSSPTETPESDLIQQRAEAAAVKLRKIEGREWWLWGFAVVVTLVLTLGIASFTVPWFHISRDSAWYWAGLKDWMRGLTALVVMFDIYTGYQHLQLYRTRRQLFEQNQLFRLISENAADMIALEDWEGRPLYNSPSFEKVLGYSPQELAQSPEERIHPDDRERVLEAAARARATGRGQRLEYRVHHKNGELRIVESTVNAIRNADGKVEKLVIVNRDITDRKHAEEMLAHSALHDSLTNLPNRALFLDRLQRLCTMALRHAGHKFAVLFVDIDEFKIINESLGHEAGDELLTQISRRLTASLRGFDTVARPTGNGGLTTADDTLAKLPGDEFAVLLDDLRDPSDAIRVAERIEGKLAEPFVVNGQEIVLSASIGIAMNSGLQGAQELLRDAEIAMHRAKRTGKARCEVFDSAMHATAVKRLQLETDLRKAIERGEMRVHYQPIVSLRDHRIVGFEALSRWQTPERLVMPAEFIALADETGLILPINRALIHEACQQMQAWQAEFAPDPPLTISVNVTPRQFSQPNLAADIAGIVQQTGLDPRCLELEILETVAMGNPESAGKVMADLKRTGALLTIDDFGTGYSSLGRLQGLAVDKLKIDRSFIANLETDAQSREIVRIIVMLAHGIGLSVVAEGVETPSQLELVKELGCDVVQGYLFSKPVEAAKATELIRNGCAPLLAKAAMPGM